MVGYERGRQEKTHYLLRPIWSTGGTKREPKFHNRVQGEADTVEQFVTDLKLLARDCAFQGTGRNDQVQDRIRYGFPQNSRKADKLRQRSISWQSSDWNCKNIWTAKSTIKDNGVKQWSGSWHKWGAIAQNEIFEHTFQGKNNLVANVHVKVSCPAIGKKVP